MPEPGNRLTIERYVLWYFAEVRCTHSALCPLSTIEQYEWASTRGIRLRIGTDRQITSGQLEGVKTIDFLYLLDRMMDPTRPKHSSATVLSYYSTTSRFPT